MITGNIKSQIDQVWNAFWSGGISNPLEENKPARLKTPMERRVFPEGNDGIGKHGGCPCADRRWSCFKHFAPGDMYAVIGEHVFPFLRNELARHRGGDDSTCAHPMKDARFTITEVRPQGPEALFDAQELDPSMQTLDAAEAAAVAA